MGSLPLVGEEEEGGTLSLLSRPQFVVLVWSLRQSSLNPKNSEVSAGRKEREGKGHLEIKRQVGPFPMPDTETHTLRKGCK